MRPGPEISLATVQGVGVGDPGRNWCFLFLSPTSCPAWKMRQSRRRPKSLVETRLHQDTSWQGLGVLGSGAFGSTWPSLAHGLPLRGGSLSAVCRKEKSRREKADKEIHAQPPEHSPSSSSPWQTGACLWLGSSVA